MLLSSPIRMAVLSARRMAPNQMLARAARRTSPMRSAEGATQAPRPSCGLRTLRAYRGVFLRLGPRGARIAGLGCPPDILQAAMVPRRGLEPPRPCERQHLKL